MNKPEPSHVTVLQRGEYIPQITYEGHLNVPVHPVYSGQVYQAFTPLVEYWVIVATPTRADACAVGIKNGKITKTSMHSIHSLSQRKVIGECVNLKNVTFSITLFDRT